MTKSPARRALFALLWTALLLPASAAAQGPEQEVRAADARRFEAMVRRDRQALDLLLADDLIYTHSNGQVETKAQLLASIASGALVYRSIQPRDVQVRLSGDVAVLTGRADLGVRAQERDLDLAVLFTSVYVRRDGEWRMTAWQSTRIEPPR